MKRKFAPVFLAITSVLLLAHTALSAPKPQPIPTLSLVWQYTDLMDDGYWVFDSSPSIGDLAGDSRLEAVFGTGEYGSFPNGEYGGRFLALDSAGNWLWNALTPDDWVGSGSALADTDSDGQKEVIGGSCSGDYLLSWDGGTGSVEWFLTGQDPASGRDFGEFWGAPVILDIRADYPGPEILAVDQQGRAFCVGSAGELIWLFSTWDPAAPANTAFTSTAPVADVDSDGRPEMIAIEEREGVVYILDAALGTVDRSWSIGENPWNYDVDPPFAVGYRNGLVISSPAVANLDRDAALEIVFGSFRNTVYCYDGATGKVQWRFTTGGPISSSPAIGDVDADGALEIIIGSDDGKVYCLSSAGKLEWSYTIGSPVAGSPALAWRKNTTPLAVEWPTVRGNLLRTGLYPATGRSLGIYIGAEDGYLYLLSGKGKLLDKFATVAPINSTPAVGDVDGDGRQEVLFKSGFSLINLKDLGY